MESIKKITLTRSEVDDAVKEYLSRREITFNVEEINYVIKNDGETLSGVQIKAL